MSGLSKRGSVAIMTGLLAIPLVAMTGAAIDLARVWLVKSRLQVALDAAALVVARDLATGGSSADGMNLFWANFGRTSLSTRQGYLDASATDPVVLAPAPGGLAGSVQLTSSATISPTFLGLMGIGAVTVNGASTAQSAAYGLELSLVLDITGSMAGSAIASLRTAANQLLDILYGGADTQPHLSVAVVPFAATINIGNQHTGWLTNGSLDQSKYSPKAWLGCVMARTAQTGAIDGDDRNDKTPTQAPLKPFLYASTYHKYSYTTTGTGGTQTHYYTGDNDWTSTNIQEPATGDTSVGPNLGCPVVKILPETASKSVVAATINSMTVPAYRGGTFINLGLQAGWWTISPNWRGVWGDPNMPLDYNTPYMKKVIVLMTDGNNNWNDWTGGVPGVGPSPWVDDGDKDFTAYGRLKSNVAGLSTTSANANATINSWMGQMCTTLKQNGIIIYTILFNNSDTTTLNLFRTCASSPDTQYFFNSPSQTDLQAAFKQIGQELSTLRLSQ
ncbi:MAG TPA: pilus assembly protein TadG-related protein [Acetobacteraceae bacterium]|nr:pilus assembly protein TadG-related protein [Acetobacteraceae bacterium]